LGVGIKFIRIRNDLLGGKYVETGAILSLRKRIHISTEKDETLYTGMVLSLSCKSNTPFCAKRNQLTEKLYRAKTSCVIFSF
jgi:hypothetical protein